MTSLAKCFAAALLCLACAAAGAVGWTAPLASGQVLNIVEGSTATRSGYFLERRYRDGSRDPQFGSGGRAFFTLGSDNSPPAAIAVDAAGRILVSGAAAAGSGRSAAVVLRFLPNGQPDTSWGAQGRSLAPAPQGDASAADALTLADGNVLVIGTVEDGQTERAALWRLRSDGRLDPAFAAAGVLVAAGLPESQGLSLQQTDDGTLHLAVQAGRGDRLWLEVHRWNSGTDAPLRVARQEFPEDWVGPAVLSRRAGTWHWADASQPMTPPQEIVTVPPDSPWKSSTLTPFAQPAVAEAAPAAGHAALNPFAEGNAGDADAPALTLDDLAWPGLLVAMLAALAGAWWWWRRE
jgi:uncharacterized delta-60 repeat protein